MYNEICAQALTAFSELIEAAKLKSGDLIILGCSTSEITGSVIGKDSQYECAEAIYDRLIPFLREKGIYLAAQCCEHLGRALVVEREYALSRNLEIVNAVPQPKAGGSSATAAYRHFADPCLVLHVRADAGIDVGGTLIGMHLKEVAVPVRLSLNKIGSASIICARTRPRFVGGERAVYDESLM